MEPDEPVSEHKDPIQMSPDIEPYQDKSSSPEHYALLLEQLRSEDVMVVLQSAMQLSVDLSVATEEQLRSFPSDQFIPAIIAGISNEVIPDIGLYCILALNHLLDVFPNVSGAVVTQGGVSALQSKLGNFEYIDMAEHAISVLEKLSYDNALPILKEGGFLSIMNLLDFFEQSSQKKALTGVVNAARAITDQETFSESMMPLIPCLINALQFKGAAFLPITEKALEFFVSLVENLSQLLIGSEAECRMNFEILCENGLIEALNGLLANATDLAGSIFGLLTSLCQFSPQNFLMFWQPESLPILTQLLNTSTSKGSIAELLQLINTALPNPDTSTTIETEKAAFFQEHVGITQGIGEMFLPFIFESHELSDRGIREICMELLEKLIQLLDPETLAAFIVPAQAAAFVSDLIQSTSAPVVKKALVIVQALTGKLSETISRAFEREGVVQQLQRLTVYEKLSELTLASGPTTHLRIGSKKELKMLLLESGIPHESPIFEKIFGKADRKKKRRTTKESESGPGSGGSDVEQDPEEEGDEERLPSLKRFLTEPPELPDQLEVFKNDIMSLANQVLSGIQVSRGASETQQQLAEVVEKLENQDSEALEVLARLLTQDITSYELNTTGVCAALWNWVSSQPAEEVKTDVMSSECASRLVQLFTVLSHSHSDGTLLATLVNHLGKLLKLQQKVTGYASECENTATILNLRSLVQKMRIKFHYNSEASEANLGLSLDDYRQSHEFFRDSAQFSLHVDPFDFVGNLCHGLQRVRSKQDLNVLKKVLDASELRGLTNSSQPNIMRQQDRLSQLIREGQVTLEELKEQFAGNEELLQEIIGKLEQEENEEGEEEDEEGEESHVTSVITDSVPVEGAQATPGVQLLFLGEHLPSDRVLWEALTKSESPFNPDNLCHLEIRLTLPSAESSAMDRPQSEIIAGDMLSHLLSQVSDVGVPSSTTLAPTLRLLKLIYAVLSSSNILEYLDKGGATLQPLEPSAFVCPKFNQIMSRQLTDVQAVTRHVIPPKILDLYSSCGFLFDYPIRHELYRSGGVGGTRAIYFLANRYGLGNLKILRQKVSVPRSNVLDAAVRIVRDPQILKQGVLDIEYYEEEGVGLGPTLEFYSLVSQEIRGLPIWRNCNALFPAPLSATGPEVLDQFEYIGRLVAKALYDDRMIDLPFSPVFWKLVFGEALSVLDLQSLDPQIGETVVSLSKLASKKQQIDLDGALTTEHKQRQLSALTYKGAAISDLALVFTLPGYDQVELKDCGATTDVTLDNLEEYCRLVVEVSLGQFEQASAFREGFEKVFPVSALRSFTAVELENLICGSGDEKWTIDALAEAIVPAHGYYATSEAYQYLLQAMVALTTDEKRQFLSFVTGSPRLPVGGFKGLHPPLTVVRKDIDPGLTADAYLPSVMTCQNYLKLPNYSSLEILQAQLRYAYSEARQSFHLS